MNRRLIQVVFQFILFSYINPSFTKGGQQTPKGFSSIPFDQNNLETSNLVQCNFNNIHIEGYDQI